MKLKTLQKKIANHFDFIISLFMKNKTFVIKEYDPGICEEVTMSSISP